MISDITKTKSNNCFIIHCFEENNDKCIITLNTIYFRQAMFYFTVCELDIALGNHALHAQPTNCSLIYWLRCFPELTVGFQPMRRQMVTTMYNDKQLLDLVFVISRIIKVSVRVISLSLRLITPTSILVTLNITKTSPNNCI